MGTTYCLFKRTSNQRYELDKGSWSYVFDYDKTFKIKNIYQTSNDLFNKLKECLTSGFIENTDFIGISESIYDWCEDDLIEFWMEGDSGFESEFWEDWMKTTSDCESKYPYTGSRFSNSESEL